MNNDPQLTEFFLKRNLDKMAEKHPALIVRQLAQALIDTRKQLKASKALVETASVGYSVKEALKDQLKREAAE